MALLGVGCGGGGDDGSDRAVNWTVDRVLGPKSARLRAVVETCWTRVWLESPIIEYSGDRAYVELRHSPEKSDEDLDSCLLGLSIVHRRVSFERDLDELTLFDSSTDPPAQRWPLPQ